MNSELIKIADVKRENRSHGVYIELLMKKGKINKYVTDDGYLAYSPAELEAYKQTVKRGRPIK